MEKSLRGQTALVTGAAKRIGRQIALTLAGEGVNLVVHYRDSAEEAKELCAEIAGRGVKSWPVQADFEIPAEYDTLIERAMESSRGLNILINSASIFPASTLRDLDLAGLMKNIQVNAWVPFALSREFARRAREGKIINLLHSRIDGYDWAHVSYILSKHVLSVFTRMTALDFAPRITVNGVAPGLILPPPGKDHSYLDQLTNTVPLQRHGGPPDIAEAVLYFLKNDFVTGQVIHVDGGRHLMEYPHGSHPDSRP